eukprot:TRINITY_DN2633_c0_g1_i8.p1 TRINITY_DN2633_c0_g1~~TRINITY_DN2633_c0_g1_i8.p1  ORF type:complete len:638 (-),score=140.13 TRINITY_DN2633_c0_g1_i8:189-2102(-)
MVSQTASKLCALVASLSQVEDPSPILRVIKNELIGNPRKKIILADANLIPILVSFLHPNASKESVIQSCGALASFAHGNELHYRKLMDHSTIDQLVDFLESTDVDLVNACSKALKAIVKSDFLSSRDVLKPETFAKLTRHLRGNEIYLVATSLLILSSGQLAMESFGTIFADVHTAILRLLCIDSPNFSEVALDALSKFTKASLEFSNTIAQDVRLQEMLLRFVRDRRPTIRMLSVKSCVNIVKSGATLPSLDVSQSLIPVVVKLLSEKDIILQQEAPLILASMVQGNTEYQKVAADIDSVSKIATLLLEGDKTTSLDPEYGKPLTNYRLVASSLHCIAALGADREDCRELIINAKLLPVVVSNLSSLDKNVRLAACKCALSISRSNKYLRTSFVESGIVDPLFLLLQDDDTGIQSAACAVICNVVLDFSPMKKLILQKGGIPRLVELTSSMDYQLRLNSIWALKNLIYDAEPLLKDAVMKEMSFSRLFGLIMEGDEEIQIQALSFLRNLPCTKSGTCKPESILQVAGAELLSVLELKLNSTNTNILKQALYAICNLASGDGEHKNLLLRPSILARLQQTFVHQEPSIRIASCWCLTNLIWEKTPGVDHRIQALQAAGFDKIVLAVGPHRFGCITIQ